MLISLLQDLNTLSATNYSRPVTPEYIKLFKSWSKMNQEMLNTK